MSRMDRIMEALSASKYSIHDLSRCRGEGDDNLSRFNMPLELGMAMAQRYYLRKIGDDHEWMALVPTEHLYQRFLSDLAGFDLYSHDETVETLVPALMSWLVTRPDALWTPSPRAVLGALPAFRKARESLARVWHDKAPWPHLINEALRVAVERRLVPAPVD